MMKNSLVLIRKLAAADNPAVRTPDDDVFVEGGINYGLSLPVAYEVECTLLNDIVAGSAIKALRHKRNGVEPMGVFLSSQVESVEHLTDRTVVRTANSVYEVISLSPTGPELVGI